MSRGIFAVVALAIAGAACLTQPAKADGFSFSYSSGYYGHGHGGSYYHGRYYAPRPVYYAPRPRVIYRAPTVVYAAPPPTVVYADPPPVIVAPPVVANNVLPGGPLQQPAPYCREYQTTTTVGGQRTSSYGTACQQPDGSWRIVQ